MARPPKYNAEYYTHLADLRNDRRIKAIRVRFGAAGYGLLHMLLEVLTDADYTVLSTDEMELELLAGDFGVPATDIISLIQLAEKIGYFTRTEGGLLTCPELVKSLEPVFDKRNRAKSAALNGEKSNAPWLKHTAAVFQRDNHQCIACGSKNDLTLDHIIPRIAGGTDAIANLQTLCGPCNSSKGSKLPQPVAVIPQSKEKESKELLNSNSESKTPPAPGEGEVGSQKKIGAENSATIPAADPTTPPVAAPPHSSPSSWPPADPAHPFPGVVLPFASEAFAELWGRWRQVATERGCGYRGAMSEQESLKRLTGLSGVGPGNETNALEIIKQTLGSPTWKNFYALKPETDVRQQSTTIRTNRLAGLDSSQRNKIGNPSFAGDVA